MKEILKSDKLPKFAFFAGLAAIFLIFLSSMLSDTGKDNAKGTADTELESKVADMLLSMDGIDSDSPPKVMVKLDKDGLTVLGVTVVSDKAGSPMMKEKMLEAVSKALDVLPSRICITT